MKKILPILALLLVFLIPAEVLAADVDEETLLEEGFAASGYHELFPLIPEEGKAFFRDGFSREMLEEITPQSVMDWLFSVVAEKAAGPLKLFLSLAGVLLLTAASDCFSDQVKGEPLRQTLSSAAALTITGILSERIIRIVSDASGIIEDLSMFMLSFIPVFAGAAAAAGRPATAAVYHGTVFAATQFFSQIAGNLILPLISIFLALSFAASVTDVIRTDAISKAVRSCAGWMLSFCLTIFIGLLTTKGMLTAPADGVAVRAAKFALSSFIPVVGGALSDAYTSLFGCMSLIRSTIGVFGIAVMAAVLLPVIIRLLLYFAALNLSAVLADILSQTKPAAVLRSCSSALSVLMAVVICYGMMILVSVTVVLLLGAGG
ncbi:MAG: hypothetical protein IKM31_00590 [Oscillospiraceae bacterium]|nr:hypothetical protein [Oscillospiraceae bacterium]